MWSRSKTLSTCWALAVSRVFLRQVSQFFPSLKLVNWLESRLIVHLNDSTWTNWCEDIPDDPANLSRELEGLSPVDSSNIALFGSRINFSQSSRVIVLCLILLASKVNPPFAFRKVMWFFRLRIMPTSLDVSSEISSLSSRYFRPLSSSLDNSMTSWIPFLASLEKIL